MCDMDQAYSQKTGTGFLVGLLFPYPIGWIITAPLYALAGALLGMLAASVVGAVRASASAASARRSRRRPDRGLTAALRHRPA